MHFSRTMTIVMLLLVSGLFAIIPAVHAQDATAEATAAAEIEAAPAEAATAEATEAAAATEEMTATPAPTATVTPTRELVVEQVSPLRANGEEVTAPAAPEAAAPGDFVGVLLIGLGAVLAVGLAMIARDSFKGEPAESDEG